MIAVGSDDNNPSAGGKVHIFEYNDNTRWVVLVLMLLKQCGKELQKLVACTPNFLLVGFHWHNLWEFIYYLMRLMHLLVENSGFPLMHSVLCSVCTSDIILAGNGQKLKLSWRLRMLYGMWPSHPTWAGRTMSWLWPPKMSPSSLWSLWWARTKSPLPAPNLRCVR